MGVLLALESQSLHYSLFFFGFCLAVRDFPKAMVDWFSARTEHLVVMKACPIIFVTHAEETVMSRFHVWGEASFRAESFRRFVALRMMGTQGLARRTETTQLVLVFSA